MRIFYLFLGLQLYGVSLFAQPDPSQKATFALSLQYELQLTSEQIRQLDSAEYVFLRDYQMGNSSLKTAEEHQAAYFNYFRPMLKEEQQSKLDEIVRQYEAMLSDRNDRQEQQTRATLRKRFDQLYLTQAQLDSLYLILHPKTPDYPQEQAITNKRKRIALQKERQLERIKAVLDRTQYNKYLVIRRQEEEEVLKMQANTIQQTYAPLQLTLEQAQAFYEFEEYDKGIDQQGNVLPYWEMQEQRTAFMEGLLEEHQMEAFRFRQEEEIRKYEEQMLQTSIKDREYLQAAEQLLNYEQEEILPSIVSIRSEFQKQLTPEDDQKIQQLRKLYLDFLTQKEASIKAHHQRFNRTFRKDHLRKEMIQLNRMLLLPTSEEFILQLNQNQAIVEELSEKHGPALLHFQAQLSDLQEARKEFQKTHFVMNENWITTYNYQEKLSDSQEKTNALIALLLLSPYVDKNLDRLKKYRFVVD